MRTSQNPRHCLKTNGQARAPEYRTLAGQPTAPLKCKTARAQMARKRLESRDGPERLSGDQYERPMAAPLRATTNAVHLAGRVQPRQSAGGLWRHARGPIS